MTDTQTESIAIAGSGAEGLGAARRPPEPVELTYLGRSTVLIGIDGVRILTDPSVPASPALGWSRRTPPVKLPEVDVVVVSHGHARHMNLATLRRLPGTPRILAPGPQARALMRAGLARVEAVEAGDVVGVGPVAIQAVAGAHGTLHGALPPRHEPVGFLISGSSSVYFAGDAVPSSIAGSVRGVDVALLPVAPFLQYVGHLSPSDAAQNARLTTPRVVVPVHWAAAGADELLPPWVPRRETFTPDRLEADLRRAFAAAGVTAELRVLEPGYSTTVDPPAEAVWTAIAAPATASRGAPASLEKGTAHGV